jgi:hypothetical protein
VKTEDNSDFKIYKKEKGRKIALTDEEMEKLDFSILDKVLDEGKEAFLKASNIIFQEKGLIEKKPQAIPEFNCRFKSVFEWYEKDMIAPIDVVSTLIKDYGLSKDEAIKEMQQWNEYIDSCLHIQTGFPYINMMGIQKLAETLFDAINDKKVAINSVLNIKQIRRLVYLCLCLLGKKKINKKDNLELVQILCENEDRKEILLWIKKHLQKPGITIDEINGYSVVVCYSFKNGLPKLKSAGTYETEGNDFIGIS